MRKLKCAILAFVLISFATSCSDNLDSNDTEYLIFGHFYGECFGEQCIEIFKLEDEKLFEDINDTYPSGSEFYIADFKQLDESKFELVKDLFDFFPAELLDENETILGAPDAGDWGGLYVEYNMNGTRQFWLIDQMKQDVPEYIHLFIDKINATIALINS